jgi:hypothetical protein
MSAAEAAWVPANIRYTPAGPLIDWCHLGDLRFTDPFYVQTIERALRHPFNLLFRRSTLLDALAAPQECELRLAGLIFHMTHCGSTLVAQMLASLPANVVLSEPRPIDRLLRAPIHLAGVSREQLVRWMRAIVGAMARRRHPPERDVFIKFDGWHVLALPLLRCAFPHTPWAFIYREPVEVLTAMTQRFPGEIDPALMNLTWVQVAAMPVERYCAALLHSVCSAAIEQYGQGGGLLIDHRELPDAACTRLLEHFGLHYGGADLACMRAVARFDAKEPTRAYVDDSEAKRSMATPGIRTAAQTLLDPLRDRLDALRISAT